MTTQPAHCPVCHEPIGESCIRSLAIVPRSDDDAFARSMRDQTAVSFHRCKCGAKTSMDSTTIATYAAPQATSICCPVCGKPINDSAIVTWDKSQGDTLTGIHFQCECGAIVEVTDMNQDEDHLSLFGRAMTHRAFSAEHGKRHVFACAAAGKGLDTFIRDDNGTWQYETLGECTAFTFATKFDARDACERAIHVLSSRLQTLIEGGIMGL